MVAFFTVGLALTIEKVFGAKFLKKSNMVLIIMKIRKIFENPINFRKKSNMVLITMIQIHGTGVNSGSDGFLFHLQCT